MEKTKQKLIKKIKIYHSFSPRTIFYAVLTVAVFQEACCSVRVQDAQILWTVNPCRTKTHLLEFI